MSSHYIFLTFHYIWRNNIVKEIYTDLKDFEVGNR